MPYELYELSALAARYWFVFLMAVIVFRSIKWLMRDHSNWKKRLKSVPSAGNVGEAVIVLAKDLQKQGQRLDISREGIIGSHKSCDICIENAGLNARHIYYRFEENHGLYIELIKNSTAVLDDVQLNSNNNKVYILHGSVLIIADIVLKIFFFSGLGVPFVSLDVQNRSALEFLEQNQQRFINYSNPQSTYIGSNNYNNQNDYAENDYEENEYNENEYNENKYNKKQISLNKYEDVVEFKHSSQFTNPDDMQSFESLGGDQ